VKKMSPVQRASWKKIMDCLVFRGGGEEDLKKVVRCPTLVCQIATLIKDGVVRPGEEEIRIGEEEFPVEVDGRMSFREMLAAGNYDSVESLQNKHFRIRRRKLWKAIVVLVKFNYESTFEQAEFALRFEGLAPARMEEFLAFGAQHSDVQRRCDIITPAWRWEHKGSEIAVPRLSSQDNGQKRVISVSLLYEGVHRFHYILARRREIKE